MEKRKQRFYIIMVSIVIISVALLLIFKAYEKSIVFFYTPTKMIEARIEFNTKIRLGGLVEEGSVKKEISNKPEIHFNITDLSNSIPTIFTGIPPNLFREGQGVVAEGYLSVKNIFIAEKIFAKHDENYMPAEVANAIQDSGYWKNQYGAN